MKDKEATEGKDPILDSRGLMCDVQQLRYTVHTLACNLSSLLNAVPALAIVLGQEKYEAILEEVGDIHAMSCDKGKADLPVEEDPTWRLFNQTND